MTAQFFADTNIFLYAGSKDPADAEKRKVARQLIANEDIGLSAQVMQEFVAVAATRKRLGIDEAEAKVTLQAFLDFPVVPITPNLVIHALDIQHRYQVSYWDAAIIAAALELCCEVIFSEDLNSGQDYGGVLVQNPFAGLSID